jgi:hypothetical protein
MKEFENCIMAKRKVIPKTEHNSPCNEIKVYDNIKSNYISGSVSNLK